MSPFYKLKLWLKIAEEEKEKSLKEKMLEEFQYVPRTDQQYDDDYLRCSEPWYQPEDDNERYINDRMYDY